MQEMEYINERNYLILLMSDGQAVMTWPRRLEILQGTNIFCVTNGQSMEKCR